jgi:hypothetical protein
MKADFLCQDSFLRRHPRGWKVLGVDITLKAEVSS